MLDSDVRSAIWYALHRAGMEIPFPSRNINVTEMNEDRVQRKLDEEYARRVDALARVDVFRALDAEKIDQLARRLRHVVFGPGEVILRQGDPGDSLYVVRGGTVVVQIGVLGASKEIATLGDGQFFGEMSLMTGESRTATVVAKTDVECYVVDKEAFQRDRPGEARAGRDHQRHPFAPAGRPGRQADADARAQRGAEQPAPLEDRRVLRHRRRQGARLGSGPAADGARLDPVPRGGRRLGAGPLPRGAGRGSGRGAAAAAARMSGRTSTGVIPARRAASRPMSVSS